MAGVPGAGEDTAECIYGSLDRRWSHLRRAQVGNLYHSSYRFRSGQQCVGSEDVYFGSISDLTVNSGLDSGKGSNQTF